MVGNIFGAAVMEVLWLKDDELNTSSHDETNGYGVFRVQVYK